MTRKRGQLTTAALIAATGVLAASGPSPAAAPVNAACARAYDLAYNLDYPEALAAFRQAIADHPDDPAAYRGVATITWLYILFQRGVVTVDDYLRIRTDAAKLPVPDEEARQFQAHLGRALALAEEEVRRQPSSAAAHYDLGSAVGLTATYKATVEASVLGGLRAARRAYSEQEKVLQLDPARKDAGLIAGTYRYVVACLPFPVRVMAYVAGFGGGRERGLQLIEEAAAYPGDSQFDAKFALVLLYNREQRYDEALQRLRELQQRFPRNRLLWLEAGATELRAGRPAQAQTVLTTGLEMLARDTRPRSLGEQALFLYKRGAARTLLGDLAGAERDLRAAAEQEGREWVRGRVHLELGKVADLRGNRAQARAEYQAARRLCEATDDSVGVEQAKKLLARVQGVR